MPRQDPEDRITDHARMIADIMRRIDQIKARYPSSGGQQEVRLAKTTTSGTYPTDPADTFEIVFLQGTFTETAGDQTPTYTDRQTASFTVAYNVTGKFLPEDTVVTAFHHNDRWWIISAAPNGAAEIIRFRYKVAKAYGANQVGVKLKWNGAALEDEGADIGLVDRFGVFGPSRGHSTVIGSSDLGYALKFADLDTVEISSTTYAAYEVIYVEGRSRWYEVTTTEDMGATTTDEVAAGTNDSWGSPDHGSEKVTPVTSLDKNSSFPEALSGAKGTVSYDEISDEYAIVWIQQRAWMLKGDLASAVLTVGSTSVLNNAAVLNPAAGQLQGGVISVTNRYGYDLNIGTEVCAVWDHDSSVYIIVAPFDEPLGKFILFTAPVGFTTGFNGAAGSNCDVDDWFGGTDPGASTAVSDAQLLFPRAVVGSKGVAVWDDDNGKYSVLYATQLAECYVGSLQSAVSGTSATSVINSPDLCFPDNGIAAAAITATNDLGYELAAGAKVAVVWNKNATDKYTIIASPGNVTARWIEFTTRAGHTGFSATCDVDDYHGGADPGATVTVTDPAGLWPVCNGVGFQGIALYDDGADNFVAVQAEELAFAYIGTLATAVSATSDTSVINAVNRCFPGSGQTAASITAKNNIGYTLGIGANVYVVYNHGDTPAYSIVGAKTGDSQAKFIEFTTRAGHTTFNGATGVTCDVDDFHCGTDPGATVTVADTPANWLGADKVGLKGTAFYDDGASKYEVIHCEQRAFGINVTLSGNLRGTAATSSVSAVTVMWPPGAYDPGTSITVHNEFGAALKSGDEACCVWNHAASHYTVASPRLTPKAIGIDFTTVGATFPDTSTVNAYYLGDTPGATHQVDDPQSLFPGMIAGCKGYGVLNEVNDEYQPTHMQEQAVIIEGTLSGAALPKTASNTVTSPVVVAPASGKLPSGTVTFFNDHDYSVASGETVWGIWNEDASHYVLVHPIHQHGLIWHASNNAWPLTVPTTFTQINLGEHATSFPYPFSFNGATDEITFLQDSWYRFDWRCECSADSSKHFAELRIEMQFDTGAGYVTLDTGTAQHRTGKGVASDQVGIGFHMTRHRIFDLDDGDKMRMRWKGGNTTDIDTVTVGDDSLHIEIQRLYG